MPWSLSEMAFSLFCIIIGWAGIAYKDLYLNTSLMTPIFSNIFDTLCIIVVGVFIVNLIANFAIAARERNH